MVFGSARRVDGGPPVLGARTRLCTSSYCFAYRFHRNGRWSTTKHDGSLHPTDPGGSIRDSWLTAFFAPKLLRNSLSQKTFMITLGISG
jgi:hypothetical protein